MSAGYGEEVDSALKLIINARLPHPLYPLLASFILEALNPRLPARYVLGRCRAGENLQKDLLGIVEDWRFIVESRMFHPCCVPVSGTNPLSTFEYSSIVLPLHLLMPKHNRPSGSAMAICAALPEKQGVFGTP